VRFDLVFDGQRLAWNGRRVYRASSGFPGFQDPVFQCVPERGPVPNGAYELRLRLDPKPARDDGSGRCKLAPSKLLQRIPRGPAAGECELYWAQWGKNRVRVDPHDQKTRAACTTRREGFYLHDSVKGYSHGCIEVDPMFFLDLRVYMRAIRTRQAPPRDHLLLRVAYVPGRSTYGGTLVP